MPYVPMSAIAGLNWAASASTKSKSSSDKSAPQPSLLSKETIFSITDLEIYKKQLEESKSHGVILAENSGCPSLKSLELYSAYMNKNGIGPLISFIKDYSFLEELNLDNNPIGGTHVWRSSWKMFSQTSGVETLALALNGYHRLRKLSLRHVGLDKVDGQALLDLMDSLPAFTEISVGHNPLTIGQYPPFPENTTSMEALATIALMQAEEHACGRAELLGYPVPLNI